MRTVYPHIVPSAGGWGGEGLAQTRNRETETTDKQLTVEKEKLIAVTSKQTFTFYLDRSRRASALGLECETQRQTFESMFSRAKKRAARNSPSEQPQFAK